jgi:Xaa-Pro dipeptidase
MEGMKIYQDRREKIYGWMKQNGIALIMFEDMETRRDASVRWLSGQPGDALLFLSADNKSLLVPWDINMANRFADADTVIPYGEFGRQAVKAIQRAVSFFALPQGANVEIPRETPHPLFLRYAGALPNIEILCRSTGAYAEIDHLRAVKDKEEIRIYRHISDITNEIIDLLEKNIRAGGLKTESDAALFIEAEARKCGCEGTGFETLAAGPNRSFGIHAFPSYTVAPFAAKGLSILDFGLKYEGYTSDITLTFARESSPAQEEQLSLTEKAYELAFSMVGNGVFTRDIAGAVDDFFGRAGRTMPHSLGHGVGLDAHEFPSLRNAADNEWCLAPGMIFTLEPGLYDPALGGCRLENDVLLTENGAEVLTNARVVRL